MLIGGRHGNAVNSDQVQKASRDLERFVFFVFFGVTLSQRGETRGDEDEDDDDRGGSGDDSEVGGDGVPPSTYLLLCRNF